MNTTHPLSDYLPQPYNRSKADMLARTFGQPRATERQHHDNYIASIQRREALKKAWGLS